MNVQFIGTVARIFVIALVCTETNFAKEIEVVVDSAQVKVEDRVVGTVEKGQRFQVRRRTGPWIAIRLNTAQGGGGWLGFGVTCSNRCGTRDQ